LKSPDVTSAPSNHHPKHWGIGYYLYEEPLRDNRGTERSQGVWAYKPPMAPEVPIELLGSVNHPINQPFGVPLFQHPQNYRLPTPISSRDVKFTEG
jgi:hypothetical protein